MLRALDIRDFVIVERVELEPGKGFTVLTGETGAGKSILVDAIELLVGGRAGVTVVREGAERAELAAEFEVPGDGPLARWLAAQDLAGDPGALLLRRSIDRAGRSRCFVNGHAATLAQLREAGEFLVDIHGRHEHQSLLRAAAQRELLDAQAGSEAFTAATAQAWREWKRIESLVSETRAKFAEREAERTALAVELAELKRLAPRTGEWSELSGQHARLAHGSSLLAGAQSALEALSEAEGACLPQLAAVVSRLRTLAEHDTALAPMIELLESAQAQAEEAARALRHYGSRVELDPAVLREVELRIEAWHAAARRLRVRPEELPERIEQMRVRLAELELSGDPEALEREVAAARARCEGEAAKLSAKRRSGAQAFSRAVTEAMQKLALTGARFNIALRTLEVPAVNGAEEVEFEVAAHASLPLRPLARVASGGELSRISLAIQLVAAKSSPVGTLIFDEVDSGIGGGVAETVGQALKRLGRERQVLCVTHLPQVAAQGDAHWAVEKSVTRGPRAPRVSVEPLARAARVEEIARMLGGSEITATTRKHAVEMLGI